MPTKLSSRDVLLYLNEMGYTNINAQQLKEFMQDLKKLIRYEERRKLSTSGESSASSESQTEYLPADHFQDIFTRLHAQETVESRAKKAEKKPIEKIIRVQIKQPKQTTRQVVYCDHTKENDNVDNILGNKERSPVVEEGVHENSPVEQKKLVEKGTNTRKFTGAPPKKRVAFLRPQATRPGMKSDPVALYHQYQAEWKRVTIPGENNWDDLRWAIREKMMTGPR